MENNIGIADRIIRPVVAAVLLGSCADKSSSLLVRGTLALAGLALIVTSIAGKCPAYHALGISTKHHEPADALLL
jgi:hypothetical protein